MRILTLIAAATALGGIAAPAAAQYYPQPSYPQPTVPQPYPGQPGYNYPGQGYPQQGYAYPQQQGGIAGIIGQLLGNRYQSNDRTAISQCASAASAEAARRYRPAYGDQYGYNQYATGQARVTAITNVERRNRGLRVTGLLDTGANGHNQPPYGNAYGYNQQYAQGDLSFRCNVDYTGRVTNVRLSRVR
ncbi:hypothetical protein ACFQPG_10830 [Sphingomonas sp. GCM10030256]|uniref:hypothetical protein n=1 Tax=Sphingomonas sp. GCM10030256 TaxID=3273427 RepID=UPI003608212D